MINLHPLSTCTNLKHFPTRGGSFSNLIRAPLILSQRSPQTPHSGRADCTEQHMQTSRHPNALEFEHRNLLPTTSFSTGNSESATEFCDTWKSSYRSYWLMDSKFFGKIGEIDFLLSSGWVPGALRSSLSGSLSINTYTGNLSVPHMDRGLQGILIGF